MKRLAFVALAFLFGCSGVGSGGSGMLPAGPASPSLKSGAPGAAAAAGAGGAAAAAGVLTPAHHGKTKVRFTMRIPRHHRGETAATRHPATISSLTQSVSIAIDGGTAQVFNATPSSAGCAATATGTVCTFVVDAPIGTDTFVVSTYSATGGGGSLLDRGSAVVPIVTGQANAPSVTLGPVVTTTADSGVGSLRYAVGSANSGDTILFVLGTGAVINLATPITIAGRVSIAGPGVTVSARRRGGLHAHTTYSGVTLSGGGLQQIFVLKAGATATISGLILTGGSATVADQPGGAIYNAGTLSLVSDVFVGNSSSVNSPFVGRAAARPHHAHGRRLTSDARPAGLHPHCAGTDYYGGAVYNHATLSITGTVFDGNVVDSNPSCSYYGYGGAIYNDEYGILTSSGDEYTNNNAYSGGAVYNNSVNGQASFTGDTFDANLGCTATTGCPTSGCAPATAQCTSYAYGAGAAIADVNGPGVSISNSTFENNVVGGSTAGSQGYGGALLLDTGSPSITGSTFTGNQAGGGSANCSEGNGGAIYFDTSGPLELDNDTFTGNVASGDDYGDGGAMEGYTPLIGSNDTFTSNQAVGSGSPCHTSGGAFAGAIDAENSTMTLTGSTFKNNVATAAYESQGGALYNYQEAVTLSGDTFTSNSTTTTSATSEDGYAYGGAIFIEEDASLKVSGSSFTSNSAVSAGTDSYEAFGGAIYNAAAFTSSGNSYASNSISIGGASASEAFGGAVFSYGNVGTVTMVSVNDTFTSNSATATGTANSDVYGGAIYSDDPLTVSGGTFTSNSVSGPYDVLGGAISGYGASVVSNGTFTSNVAGSAATTPNEVYGGAIDDEGGFTIGGSTFNGNTAIQSGGAVYANNNSDTIANSTISGNRVTAANEYAGGGAVFGCDGFSISNATVIGNSVALAATGAIHAGGGGLYNNGDLTAIGTTISGNSVLGTGSGDGGGGIFNYYPATITNTTITGNSSSVDGGGFLELGNYNVEFVNDTFFQNRASGIGGNISNPSGDTIGLANSIVAGGAAATGPDIDNAGTITSGGYNIIQTTVVPNVLTGTTTGNQTANPVLLTLANNGGPTFTNADTALSPGAADIPFAAGMCNGQAGTGVDQRGFTRGVGGRCDVGAYELAGVASSVRSHGPAVRTHPAAVHGHPHPGRRHHHARLPQLPPSHGTAR